MRKKIIVGFVAVLAIGLFTFSTTTKEDAYWEMFFKDYRIYAIPIAEKQVFAGELVPIQDFDVRERLDRELLVNAYWQSTTLLHIKRAARWFPIIEPILKEQSVPEDFKYLAVIESGLANVVSPSGATGFWQFMKGTAEQYKLEVNDEVDERYDLVKSTYAACAYFKDAYRQFGSWTMVAASYNMGIGGLTRQAAVQKQTNFYDLHLNTETSRYVSRIIAVKNILEHPKKYGYHLRKKDHYQPVQYKAIIVNKPVEDFVEFALANGSNYKHVKLANPWIRKSNLSNRSGKEYSILIPETTELNYEVEEEYQLERPETSEHNLKKPISYFESSHIVQKGETLQVIAATYQVTAANLILWNQLKETTISKGQKLKIKIPIEE